MRFTTWSALTNTFIISTVALLWLIQAVNAQEYLYLGFESPKEGNVFYPASEVTIEWFIIPSSLSSAGLQNVVGDIFLVNDDFNFKSKMQSNVHLIDDSSAVALPEEGVIPSKKYYIEIDTGVPPYKHKSEKITIEYR